MSTFSTFMCMYCFRLDKAINMSYLESCNSIVTSIPLSFFFFSVPPLSPQPQSLLQITVEVIFLKFTIDYFDSSDLPKPLHLQNKFFPCSLSTCLHGMRPTFHLNLIINIILKTLFLLTIWMFLF